LIEHVEGMMGFDVEATKGIIETLGAWDETAVHDSVLELLPEELSFPMRRRHRSMPYDHRIHLLVEELLTRMGDDARSTDEIIKNCGHILCHLCHHEDEYAAARLLLHQAILLADDYVRSKPRDIMGDCWRGEVACWEGNYNLAKEYAEKIWTKTASTHSLVNSVTWFFALTTPTGDVFSQGIWKHFGYITHLGELKDTWIDREQTFALAIVRAAFKQGTFDTSLLLATFALRHNGYSPDPDDAPAECWVWMAEQIEGSLSDTQLYHIDTQLYYEYWCNAFYMLSPETNPNVAHNIIVVLLTGLLYNKIRNCECEPPSIQRVLDALIELHRSDSFPQNYRAALETIEFYEVLHRYHLTATDHLTAGDKLAITKSLEHLKRLRQCDSKSARTHSDKGDYSKNRFIETMWTEAESNVRKAIGEGVWARLEETAREEFKKGEFAYMVAETLEGEGGNFNAFVSCYSNGLLFEIQQSLRGPIVRDRSLRAEYSSIFGDNKPPEWGGVMQFIENLEKHADTRFVKALMAQRVSLDRINSLREPFQLMKTARDDAAHTKVRIDRERAILLHDRLFNGGLIREVVGIFRKAPRR
jgi:hypothetical protein